jgi:hypothetical protein
MAALLDDTMADEESIVRRPVTPISRRFLLSPFNWVADSVASLADLDPTVCVELCKIEGTRMHVMALALANLEVEPNLELGRLLLCGSIRQVFTETLGRSPPAGIRRLIELLDHGPTAKLLFHMDKIDDALIDLLYQTSPPLRRPVLRLAMSRGDDWSHYAGLCDGLHILVARGAADSFEELVCTLASAKRPEQFLGRLRSVCDSLPLPEATPGAPRFNALRGRALAGLLLALERFFLASHPAR